MVIDFLWANKKAVNSVRLDVRSQSITKIPVPYAGITQIRFTVGVELPPSQPGSSKLP